MALPRATQKKLERLALQKEMADAKAPVRKSKAKTGAPPKVALPDLTPFQARKLRPVLQRAVNDPIVSPRTQELCAWLMREIEKQL